MKTRKEERDVLEEEMREKYECDMEEFGALDSSEGNDGYPRR